MHCKYFLYAQPNNYVFTLKKDGEDWQKEFSSISDAIIYAEFLPDSEESTVVVYDQTGSQLAELRVQNDAMAAI